MSDNSLSSLSLVKFQEIDIEELSFGETVNSGTYGVVRKAKWKSMNVAVKVMESEEEKKAFRNELKQLSKVDHENIVKLFGACVQQTLTCLVMEYAEGGSLYDLLHNSDFNYSTPQAMYWLYQCSKGVEYLHKMRIVHRDLKSPNLLLVGDGTRLTICDFGTACEARTHMTNCTGSAAWMAPEVFEGNNYTEKCDVYSFGIIVWEVTARKKPFDSIGGGAFRIMWAVHQGERPPLVQKMPQAIENMMTRCWDKNPTSRPPFKEIVEFMDLLLKNMDGYNEPLFYDGSEEVERYDSQVMDVSGEGERDKGKGTARQVMNDPPQMDEPVHGLQRQLSGTLVGGVSEMRIEDPEQTVYGEEITGHQDARNPSVEIGYSYSGQVPQNLHSNPGDHLLQSEGNNNRQASTTNRALQALGQQRCTPRDRNNSLLKLSQNRNAGNPGVEKKYPGLDWQLQPIPPASNPDSQRIFREHCQMAEEYLQVLKEIEDLELRKAELNRQLELDRAELDKGRKRLEDYNRLMEVKERLLAAQRECRQELNGLSQP
ncbi:mitogen-activated protein kinase kinase kinase 7-like [Corticium candelabrum]|uniref:mitogen-activated protein kinase kinase kinase 7-like n=1 Tax=Corticium candelabrum TaxID=121492 RepID=UPI002E262AD6|nr:mitogen-activated protein kinase kinase kinase 7-like [Corticium candelabrum]